MPRMPYPHCDQSCQNKSVSNASDNIKLKILEDKLRNDFVEKDLTNLPEVSEVKSSDYLYVYDSEQEQVKKISANEILNQVDLDDYAKKEDLNGYAEKEHSHEEYLTEHQDLTAYAKKDELFNKDYNELINKPVIPSIDGLATEQFVNDAIKNIEIPEADLSDYYTKGDIDGIIENIELKEGPAGKDGKDFKYEDFTSEQLEALRGPQGLPGEAGKDGAAGKDFTYEDFTAEQLLALKGEKGEPFKYEDFTESQLESLKGPQGEPGKAFTYEDFTAEQLEALKGKDGQNGVDGVDGKDGENGQSAYELWLALGNTGTKADFINSLKGQDGEKGDHGKDGLDGKDGLTTAIKVGEITYTHENGIITLPQYIEEIPDEYITEEELNNKGYISDISGKQDTIEDLEEIRANAALGKTALQEVPAEYITETELEAKKYLTSLPEHTHSYNDLADTPKNISAFNNDAGYLTKHQSLANYYTKDDANAAFMTQDEVDARVNKVIADASNTETITNLTTLVDYLDTHGAEAAKMVEAIEAKADSNHNHEGKELYPSGIFMIDSSAEINLGEGDDTIISPGFVRLVCNEDSIILDATNNSYLINGSDIATEDYVANAIANAADTTIGIDFTTNITVGHLSAGTQISKDQTIQEILYNILFKPTYDVKFIVDGTEYKTINVMQGEKVTKPANPSKVGYEFKGWYTDETYSTSYNFNNKIMSETFIYALFEEITNVNVYYLEWCEPDGDILDMIYSQELQKGQLVPMPNIDTIRERITEGWEWDGNFYSDMECIEYFDFENTYVTSDITIYLKVTQLPEGPIIPEGSVVDEIVTNNIPAYSGSSSNGETEVTYQLLDGNTAEPTDQGFYTITNDNNEVVQAGYQLTMEGNSNMDAQVFAVPLNASMIKAWQYDEMGKIWLEYDFPGDYWRPGEIITKNINGTDVEYQTYYYNVEDIGDAISNDEYWRFEMEVNN